MTRLVIMIGASYRLTRLAITDEITGRPRRWLTSHTQHKTNRYMNTLLSCPWCLGMWIAAGVVAAVEYLPDRYVFPVLTILALSTAVGLIAKLDDE